MYDNFEAAEERQPENDPYDVAEEQIRDEPVQREAEPPVEDAGYGDEEQLYDNMDIDTAPAQVQCLDHTMQNDILNFTAWHKSFHIKSLCYSIFHYIIVNVNYKLNTTETS